MRDALCGRVSIIGATAQWTKERGSSSRTPALGTRRLRRRQRVRLEGGGHKLPRPGEAGTIDGAVSKTHCPPFCGTEGSNPSSSGGESLANLTLSGKGAAPFPFLDYYNGFLVASH